MFGQVFTGIWIHVNELNCEIGEFRFDVVDFDQRLHFQILQAQREYVVVKVLRKPLDRYVDDRVHWHFVPVQAQKTAGVP